MSGSVGSGSLIEHNSLEARAEAGISQLDLYIGGRSAWSWEILSPPVEDRFVLAYHNGARTIIGKFYVEDGLGSVCYHVMHNLYEHTERNYLHIPKPIAYVHGHRLLLTEPAQGHACEKMDIGARSETVTRVGAALRELHALGAVAGPAKKMTDHIRELIRPRPAELALALPGFSSLIHDTLDRLNEVDRHVIDPPVLLHRDYHLRQLFDDGTHISVIDWDLSAMGDAAFDVGYFTAYLKNHYPEAEASKGIAAFLEGYGADANMVERIAIYEQFNFLRRACRRYRLKDEGWSSKIRLMFSRLDAI